MAARLYAIQARDANVAVLFRRGPSKQVLLIKWDTANDRFEEGQWLKGRIYERRCHVSPDGDLLVYFAASQKPPYGTWTAVSRPPFLTALALWPKGDAWGGGGYFADRSHLLLNQGADQMELAEGFSIPRWMKVEPFGLHSGGGEDEPIAGHRLRRDGWELVREGVEVRHSIDAPIWIEYDPARLWERKHPIWPARYRLRMSIRGIQGASGTLVCR